MALVNLREMLAKAGSGGYAIGYFEAWDMYSLEGILEAAQEMDSPAILGFGTPVIQPDWMNRWGVEEMASLCVLLAKKADVPAVALLNEATTFPQILRGLKIGVNAVMLDTSDLPIEENLKMTKLVVDVAHTLGAAVEAELGHLADAGDVTSHARMTDPVEAARFVKHTGIDALGVSIGNVHQLVDGTTSPVDMELLEQIHKAVGIPLVLHGMTGYPVEAIQPAIQRGVAKFNYGTRLKKDFLVGIKEAVNSMPEIYNIHRYMGSREETDVLIHAKNKMKETVKHYIELFGSKGKAIGW